MTQQQTSFMHLIPCKTQISLYWLHDWLTIVALIVSGPWPHCLHLRGSGLSISIQLPLSTVLERVWTGAPLWPTLECCGYTGKLPSVNVTQILERKWHPGDIKGGKNDSLTLQVPVLLRLQENTKSSPVGMELSSEWNISFFPIDHLLLLTAGEIKCRLLSFLSPRSPRGRSVCWPQAYNVKQVDPTISQSAPPD